MSVFARIRELFSDTPVSELPPSLLDAPLLHLSLHDTWTVRDAVGGAVIFGGPGSGKSSGPGKHLAMSFLKAGFGGLVLCAKPNEAEKWQSFARAAGREGDVVMFSPERPELRFNPLDYELRRAGRGAGYTQNVTALFQYLLEISEGERQTAGSDPFWLRSVLELTTYCTDVLHAAGEPVSLLNIHRLIQSCPKRDEVIDEFPLDEWRDASYCFQCLAETADGEYHAGGMKDLEMAATYLIEEFPRLSERTRTSILATFKGMALPFLRSPMREIFGADTTLRIEDTFKRGRILIIDYPIRAFGEVGRIVGAMMKYFFMTAVERRTMTDATLPCFLFADECQEHVTSYDSRFLATARESRCCTVFITQNISNLYAALKAQHVDHVTNSLLGNIMTKIFCSGADAVTNKWAADLIAQSWQMKTSSSTNTGQNTSMGSSVSQQLAWQVLPSEFATLTKGGPPDWIVETLVFQGGRIFETSGATYSRVAFSQQLEQ